MKVKKISKFALALSCLGLVACTTTIPVAPGAYKPAEDEAGIQKQYAKNEAGKTEDKKDTALLPETSYTQPDVVEVLDDDEVRVDTPKAEHLPDATPVVVPEEVKVVKPVVEVKEVTRTEHFEAIDQAEASALKHYNVVIGSFGVKTNAELLKTKMSESFHPIIVKNDNAMYRVILKSFDDYTQAHQFIDTIKEQFFDAWVLVNKK